ncbi:MAG: ABC transporter ATP-binding protein [Caldilineaceae bacterium]|nr:ABC transporter ATP-binding protein [Caldilineaceae bacterium]
MTDLLLDVKALETHFFLDEGVVRAVDGVSLQVRRGQTLGVLGESGCGKSVTGYSILRLVRTPGRIVGGEIWFHRSTGNSGQAGALDLAACNPVGQEMRQVRGAEIAMIFQEPMTSLDPVYTIGDQIAEAVLYHESISKRAARTVVIDMLQRVGLPQPETLVDKYPHQLSGGMRQRVMIAMALILRPSLLIADEPTTALDVTTEAQILELLKTLQQELGMAILFITHDLGVIAEMAQEVIVMYLGKVVEQADVKTLFRDPKHPYTQALMRSIPRLGDRNRDRLQTIEGMVPTPNAIPTGCPFHPRCSEAIPGLCDVQEPPVVDFGDGHMARCLLYIPERAQKPVEVPNG